jgi:tetratricopeptide (TPR) repeat protein
LHVAREEIDLAEQAAARVLEFARPATGPKIAALNVLALGDYNAGRYRKALEQFDEVNRLQATNRDLLRLALCACRLQDTDLAISALKASIALDPTTIPDRELLSTIHHTRREMNATRRLNLEIRQLKRRTGKRPPVE